MVLPQILTWEANTTLGLYGPLHDLLRKLFDFLSKLNGGDTTMFEHIRKYECTLCLLNIIHEDVVCRLFPLNFKGKVVGSCCH